MPAKKHLDLVFLERALLAVLVIIGPKLARFFVTGGIIASGEGTNLVRGYLSPEKF